MTARYGRPTFSIAELVKYSPKYGWARLFNFPYRGSCWRPRMHTVVVSIDGPCRINNASNPNSRAGWGVYFGPNDKKNSYGLVPSNALQTNSRAELEAVRRAILRIRKMKIEGDFDNPFNPFKEIVIRLTSQYIRDAFHKDVWQWRVSGWRTSNGKEVAHAELIEQIHTMIRDMEENMCMAVRFWQTERDPSAQALAEQAFKEEEV